MSPGDRGVHYAAAVETVALGFIWYAVLLFSLTAHEAAHAWAAWRGGDPTAYHGGQVGLDPRPHIRREPFGTLYFPIASYVLSGWMFGWASTPYDPRWAAAHPRRAAWMALAGPGANALLVVAAAVCIRAGLASGLFVPAESLSFTAVVEASSGAGWSLVATLLSVGLTLNLLLCLFNLLPFPPLDGSGALALFLPSSVARVVEGWFRKPAVALSGILVAWYAIGAIFRPVYRGLVIWLFGA